MKEFKYIQSDINDGIKLIKIGISNIIYSILNGVSDTYTLNFPFDVETLVKFILYTIPDKPIFKECINDETVYRLFLGDKSIRIYVDDVNDYYIFSLVK